VCLHLQYILYSELNKNPLLKNHKSDFNQTPWAKGLFTEFDSMPYRYQVPMATNRNNKKKLKKSILQSIDVLHCLVDLTQNIVLRLKMYIEKKNKKNKG
jgi:hypothetical protein